MRADASRNRARIVAAARELVARDGVGMTMDQLAADSGVAVGTLYRHFPTKAALVQAILESAAEEIAVLAEEAVAAVVAGAAPFAELERLVRAVAAQHASDASTKEAAALLGVPTDLTEMMADPEGCVARAGRAFATLLAAAQDAGEVRADLTLGDLIMFLTLMPGPDHPADSRERYVDVLLAGVRTQVGKDRAAVAPPPRAARSARR